ncbi:MAG: peptide deformylase [Phycisphaerales bacterium]|nr:peptide deformylase [Phycisphaerales bacterium]
MAPRQLVTYPNPVLRARARDVAEVDAWVRGLAGEMLRIMREEDGVGLAAPQVGESVRMFVTAAQEDESAPERVYINPVIVSFEGALEASEEGCLSLPGIRGTIRRPPRIAVRATGLDGEAFTLLSSGLLARCWQHEIDHLDGILIIDRMSAIDRLASRKPLRQLESAAAER